MVVAACNPVGPNQLEVTVTGTVYFDLVPDSGWWVLLNSPASTSDSGGFCFGWCGGGGYAVVGQAVSGADGTFTITGEVEGAHCGELWLQLGARDETPHTLTGEGRPARGIPCGFAPGYDFGIDSGWPWEQGRQTSIAGPAPAVLPPDGDRRSELELKAHGERGPRAQRLSFGPPDEEPRAEAKPPMAGEQSEAQSAVPTEATTRARDRLQLTDSSAQANLNVDGVIDPRGGGDSNVHEASEVVVGRCEDLLLEEAGPDLRADREGLGGAPYPRERKIPDLGIEAPGRGPLGLLSKGIARPGHTDYEYEEGYASHSFTSSLRISRPTPNLV